MKKLGNILIDKGVITEEQLQTALMEQKLVGKRLGEYLVEADIISEYTLAEALAEQFSFESVELTKENVNYEFLSTFSPCLIKKYMVVPFDCSEECISIALVDPVDTSAAMNIAKLLKRTMKPYVITAANMMEVLKKADEFYG